MATTFTLDNMLIVKEDSNGDIPSNPTLLKICIAGFDLKEEIQFDEKGCLLSETKKKVTTGTEFSGGATIDMDADTLPIVLTHVMGDPTAVVSATSDDWVTLTVHTKGDIVNHSDGVHTLVAVKIAGTGTTGASEPAITTGRGQKIVDGGVTWLVMPLLLQYSFRMESTNPTFTVEYKLTDGGSNIFYKQFSGVDMSALPLNIAGDTGVPELGLDLKPTSSVDSEHTDWVNNLEALSGMTVVDLARDYMGGACELLEVQVDSSVVTDFDSASMTIDKQLTSTNRINCTKRTERDTKIEGELTKDFTIDDYNDFRDKNTFELKMTYGSYVGASAVFTFPIVEPSQVDPIMEAKDNILVTPEISATDDSSGYAAYCVCIAPALIDSGALVGTGAY